MSVAKEIHFRSYYYFDETYLSMQILALCFHKYILHSSVSLHMMGINRSVRSPEVILFWIKVNVLSRSLFKLKIIFTKDR